MLRIGFGLLFLLMLSPNFQCRQADPSENQEVSPTRSGGTMEAIPQNIPWSQRMTLSEIKRNPEAWMIDARDKPKWNYTQGLVLMAIQRVAESENNADFFEYVKSYADTMIVAPDQIDTYRIEDFNIDHINPGNILFKLYDKTKEPLYLEALHTLRQQLEWQPRTKSGGFWHKRRYPWQMWLDGLYMGAPFYAQYALQFDEPDAFDDIVQQFALIEEKTRDAETGLLYHGWDESRLQRWSDPKTGCSPHFWGRAMGWYAMALVDVLDYFPEDHPKRSKLIDILNRLTIAVAQVQDSQSGLWYQVLDMPDREGNYLEATASSMFVYALAKGVNQGYLDEGYMKVAERGYQAIIDQLIEVDSDGEIHLLQCCAVAGLGGNPYRDGSYEYYVGEPIIRNDPKGTGPFILASMEMEKKSQLTYKGR